MGCGEVGCGEVGWGGDIMMLRHRVLTFTVTVVALVAFSKSRTSPRFMPRSLPRAVASSLVSSARSAALSNPSAKILWT